MSCACMHGRCATCTCACCHNSGKNQCSLFTWQTCMRVINLNLSEDELSHAPLKADLSDRVCLRITAARSTLYTNMHNFKC
jgi:hypothetical protein